ncbi:MAG: glucose-6-phosphate isomerase [Synergistales bacterium]|nr:glucose-6-phosphate isomerase [Synergistales bacterium]
MTGKLLKLSYGAALQERSDGVGVAWAELEAAEPSLRDADVWLRSKANRRKEGFGWIDLPHADLEPILEAGEWLASFDAVIQIGIGGSALGNRMVAGALLHPCHNELALAERKTPRFYVVENVDPRSTKALWQMIDPARTAVIVVSKSGSTAETMANFLWIWEAMKRSLGEEAAMKHLLVVTDPEKGLLRAFAESRRCRSLPLPSTVGGRYSVLSAAGLAASAALGVDVAALQEGAREMDDRLALRSRLADNPAWIVAGLHWIHGRRGRNMTVLMPYVDGLKDFTEWFAQLWGESLGKEGQGTTPVRALGAVDQHSQVQLYTEGPDDKLFTIINVDDLGETALIPPVSDLELEPLAYLGGQEMGAMLHAEARATASTLASLGRPVLWLDLPGLDAFHLGGLIYFYEYVTALTGRLLGINPFDQPGVEQGKRFTCGLMGRKGFETDGKASKEAFVRIDGRHLSF